MRVKILYCRMIPPPKNGWRLSVSSSIFGHATVEGWSYLPGCQEMDEEESLVFTVPLVCGDNTFSLVQADIKLMWYDHGSL